MATAQHRIITTRLLIASAVLGIVLTVASVPAGVFLMGSSVLSYGTSTRYAVQGRNYIQIDRHAYLFGSSWHARSTIFFTKDDLALLLARGDAAPFDEVDLPNQWRFEPLSIDTEWLHDRVGWPVRAAWASTDEFRSGGPWQSVPHWQGAVMVGPTAIPIRPL